MASSEHPKTDATASADGVRRIATYVVAGVVLLVVLWALIEGGDRDLWIRPAAFLGPVSTGVSAVAVLVA